MTASGSTKRLPRAVRERQMLDAAVRVFARRGFHAANMDEIAELSGVSKPMVYAYHGTKEELFLACLRRESERLMASILSASDSSLSPDEQLWRGLKGFFDYVGDHREGWSVLHRQARSLEPFAGELAAMRRAMVQVIAHRLEVAIQAHGKPARSEELTAMALTLVGASESLADWLVSHPEADPAKTATRLMNAVWLGAEQLLRGETWRPQT